MEETKFAEVFNRVKQNVIHDGVCNFLCKKYPSPESKDVLANKMNTFFETKPPPASSFNDDMQAVHLLVASLKKTNSAKDALTPIMSMLCMSWKSWTCKL